MQGEQLEALRQLERGEPRHRDGHDRQAQRLVGAHAHVALAAGLHHPARFLPQAHPALGDLHHRLSGVGEGGGAPAAPAVEELAAQLALKRLDAAGERGLGHKERLCCRAERACLHHGEEGLDFLEGHGQTFLRRVGD